MQLIGKTLLVLVLGAAILTPAAVAQTPAPVRPASAKKTWTAPRTPDGHPDLGGVWSNATITPLERPAELAAKPFFTREEAAAYEKGIAGQSNKDRRDGPADADVTRAYNEAWWDRGSKVVPSLRTSLIVDPPDGRLPALTPSAQEAARRRAEALSRPANGPEDRLIRERCIVGDNAGPPMMPSAYNNNFQIFETADSVAILSEMMHDVRIIPLDGRAHVPAGVRSWMGDSRGRWDNDTLVVETTNFSGKISFRGSDEYLRVVERFTRTAPDLILYEFRIEDPTAFTHPWSAEVPLTATRGPIYEYACHEGNYGMVGLLAGARAEEKKQAEKAAGK
jgi:hypothetical protein